MPKSRTEVRRMSPLARTSINERMSTVSIKNTTILV